MSRRRDIAIIDLVIANRALARIGAVDAYGHVSLRHPDAPDRFLISQSRSPELVETKDIMEVDLDGNVVNGDARPPYMERFLHAAILAVRPDLHCVVHGHARALLPFSVSETTLRPVFMTADEYGAEVPCWDIRDNFGDETDLLITDMKQAGDLAGAFGTAHRAVLMRGHGFAAGARSAGHAIRLCKALLENAAVQLEALRLGAVKEMSQGEMKRRQTTLGDDDMPGRLRDFEYEAVKAGLGALFAERMRLKLQAA